MAISQKETSPFIVSPHFIMFLLVFISGFLRFWKIEERFIFDIDTQYQALFAKTIIKDFHIIWIGVSASNIGYYLGPGLVYLTAVLLWISKGDPISLVYFSALLGIITVLSIYYITNHLYSRHVAIVSSILYGFSAFIISYDHRYWPIFVPLIAAWIFFSLVKAQKNLRWLIFSVILISLSYHIHLSLLIFWPFILWRYFKNLRRIDILTWVGSIISYIVITFPMLVFDFVHNFDNLLTPLRLLQQKETVIQPVFQSHFQQLLNLINRVWYLPSQNILVEVFLSFITIVIAVLLLKQWKKVSLLIAIMASFILLFSFYPGPIQSYYIVFLFPFIAIAAGLITQKLPRIYVTGLVALFILANIFTLITFQSPDGLNTKKKLVQAVTPHITQDYYLDFDGARDIDGWRYLFAVYGKTPAQSKTDVMFGWLYPTEIQETPPTQRLFITRMKKLNNFIYSGQFGPYFIYLLPAD